PLPPRPPLHPDPSTPPGFVIIIISTHPTGGQAKRGPRQREDLFHSSGPALSRRQLLRRRPPAIRQLRRRPHPATPDERADRRTRRRAERPVNHDSRRIIHARNALLFYGVHHSLLTLSAGACVPGDYTRAEARVIPGAADRRNLL